MVNKYRSANGLGSMKWDEKLAGLAAKHSKVMFDTRTMAHSDYPYWENIAYA